MLGVHSRCGRSPIGDPVSEGFRHSATYCRRISRCHRPALRPRFWRTAISQKVELQPRTSLTNGKWELYDTRNDFSLVNDLAATNPAKLKEMQTLFRKVAIENRVLPIDDRIVERFNAAVAGRPDLMSGRTSLTVYPGMSGMMENAFINVKNRSFSISADVHIPSSGASGVILAQGGRFGGWSLWLQDGRPRFTYNWLGRERYDIVATG